MDFFHAPNNLRLSISIKIFTMNDLSCGFLIGSRGISTKFKMTTNESKKFWNWRISLLKVGRVSLTHTLPHITYNRCAILHHDSLSDADSHYSVILLAVGCYYGCSHQPPPVSVGLRAGDLVGVVHSTGEFLKVMICRMWYISISVISSSRFYSMGAHLEINHSVGCSSLVVGLV